MTDPLLQRLLRKIPMLAERPAKAWRATPLASITNRNWRLTDGMHDLVLRAPRESSARYLSRTREFHNAGIAAALGLTPPLLYADAETGDTLQPFLADARALTAADLARPEIAVEIGAVLARLHRSGRRFEGTMAPFPIIDVYLDLARDPGLVELRRRAEPIRAALGSHPAASVPSHIDPNPANFLLRADGSLMLIDWEFSAMCEPAWDLAAVAIEGTMSPRAVAALHQGYGWQPSPSDLSRLWLMRAALHLVAATWCAAEIAGGNTAEGLAALLARCTKDALRVLEDPALGGHLAAISAGG
ncbi:MAG TPA: choline/ethanolamine kinase family protein [Candidatus Cybelea sp.]|nr:choline/ethanolamine kinase family protein [Candidatus Cybelea sp.]